MLCSHGAATCEQHRQTDAVDVMAHATHRSALLAEKNSIGMEPQNADAMQLSRVGALHEAEVNVVGYKEQVESAVRRQAT